MGGRLKLAFGVALVILVGCVSEEFNLKVYPDEGLLNSDSMSVDAQQALDADVDARLDGGHSRDGMVLLVDVSIRDMTQPQDHSLDFGTPDAACADGCMTEVCNDRDDDGDGVVDEGVLNRCGECGREPREVCDEADNDCDGLLDEGVLNRCGGCGDEPLEVCDALDNDCDDRVDEGIDGVGRICPSCSENEFDHDGDETTPCVACSVCPAGAVELEPCSAAQDRRCLLCEANHTFNEALGSCGLCTECEPGSQTVGNCTTESDRECEPCEDGTFDHDLNPETACQPCGECVEGTYLTTQCAPTQNRICEPCERGTYDHDLDPSTACEPCSVCPDSMLSSGACTATTSPVCHACDDMEVHSDSYVDVLSESAFEQCPFGDPFCEDAIDLVIFYDQTTLEQFDGDEGRIKGWSQNMVAMANEGLALSLFPPSYRYRLVGIFPMTFQGRQNTISSLVSLRFNEYFQSLRRSVGGDISVFLTDKSGPPMGYSYFLFGPVVRPDRGAVIMKTGYTAHPDRCGHSSNALTFAHELGHILGAAHNRAILPTGTGTSYAYHNQEPLHRRNEAFGLPVVQHDLRFYTLMSYGSYRPGPSNDTVPCADCLRLPMFASPDLWWFFDSQDPLFGTCLVVSADDPNLLDLQCSSREPFEFVDTQYQRNDATVEHLSAAELLSRAVPLGIDQPSFVHPDTGLLVMDETSTRGRDTALEMWRSRAQAASPIMPTCERDCAAEYRGSCTVRMPEQCGACLPNTFDVQGVCYPRFLAENEPTLHDNRFDSSGVFALPDSSQDFTIEFDGRKSLSVLEVYFGTTDELGASFYDWSNLSGFIFGVPAAPEHDFQAVALLANGGEVALSGFEVLKDSSGQQNHSLVYRLILPETLLDVDGVRLTVDSLNPVYGIEVLEVRAFGL